MTGDWVLLPGLSIAPAIILVTAASLPVVFTPFVAKLVGLTGFNNLLYDSAQLPMMGDPDKATVNPPCHPSDRNLIFCSVGVGN